jgi:hypothetical protein
MKQPVCLYPSIIVEEQNTHNRDEKMEVFSIYINFHSLTWICSRLVGAEHSPG